MPDFDLLTFVVASICVLLLGIAKAGFGGGIGVIATPLMSLVMPPSQAAATLLPLLCACDLVCIWFYRGQYSAQGLKALLPGAVAGILLGSGVLSLATLDHHQTEFLLKQMIGWIALLFVVYHLIQRWLLKRIEHYHPRPWHGYLFGTIAGFASSLAHAGGPPVSMFLLPQALDRRIFVGTTVWFFTTVNALKLIPYNYLGLIQIENLGLALMLLPLVPVGVVLGVTMNRWIRAEVFTTVIYTILFVTGVQLISGTNLLALLTNH